MRRLTVAPRPAWQALADRLGFLHHTPVVAPYWTDHACYLFEAAEVRDSAWTYVSKGYGNYSYQLDTSKAWDAMSPTRLSFFPLILEDIASFNASPDNA